MSTRFYFPSTGTSDVNPAFHTSWLDTVSATRARCVIDRIGSANTTFSAVFNTTLGLMFQYVSDPIKAQTISASTMKGTILCFEGTASDNIMQTTISVRICSNNGSVFRGDIAAFNQYGVSNEWALTRTNRRLATGNATTAVTAQEGDRFVIEIGCKLVAPGVDANATIYAGDNNASDLADDETGTTVGNGFWEIAYNVIFQPLGGIFRETNNPIIEKKQIVSY